MDMDSVATGGRREPATGHTQAIPPGGVPCFYQIRLAFHFIQDSVGRKNFAYGDSGYPTDKTTAYEVSQQLIEAANLNCDQNPVQWSIYNQQNGGFYPNIPQVLKRWNFVLEGVYLHRVKGTNQLYSNANATSSYLNDTYGVNRDSVINVFWLVSNSIGTELIGGIAGSIGYSTGGMWVKMKGLWRNWDQNVSPPPSWNQAQLVEGSANTLCHEVGHLMGLGHTFFGPACLDVAESRQAWDDSNSTMGSNWALVAMSPCEVSKAWVTLENAGKPYVANCGCRPSVAFLAPRSDTTCAGNAIWADGTASFGEKGYKLEICQVPAVGGAPIRGTEWAKTYLGTAGRMNLNALYPFSGGTGASLYNIYRLTLRTTNACRDDVYVKYIWVKRMAVGELCPIRFNRAAPGGASGEAPNEIGVDTGARPGPLLPDLTLAPNPASGSVSVRYHAATTGSGTLRIYRLTGELVAESPLIITQTGWQTLTWEPARPVISGVYRAEVTLAGKRASGRLVFQ